MGLDQWDGILGPHGLGKVNDAGKYLLSFLSLNSATICNTWFQKRDIYKQTWQHPGTKQWHCIDFTITRQTDQKRCLNATVRQGAECGSDHQLLQIEFKMSKRRLTVVIDQEYSTSTGLQSLDCVQVEQMMNFKIQSKVISKMKFVLNSAKTGQTLRLWKETGH